MEETGDPFLSCGNMVELPRASICADELAVQAEFFSFGTNDLTQTSLGISRDDSGSFLHDYADKDIYPIDPFVSIDPKGVGTLVEMGVERGRKTALILSLASVVNMGVMPPILFFEQIGLDYVSCSPYRVPAARLRLHKPPLNYARLFAL